MECHILGPFEVVEQGRAIDLGGGRQRALLAVLALHAGEVSRSIGFRPLPFPLAWLRLIRDAFDLHSLYSARSRRPVTASASTSARASAPGYVVEFEPGALDLDRFIQLRTEARACDDDERKAALLHDALALWRHAPLAELRTEPFSTSAVAQVEQQRLGALEERIEADLALGHDPRSSPNWRRSPPSIPAASAFVPN